MFWIDVILGQLLVVSGEWLEGGIENRNREGKGPEMAAHARGAMGKVEGSEGWDFAFTGGG